MVLRHLRIQGASFFWGVGFLFDCSFPLVLKQGTPGSFEGFQFSGGEVSFPGVVPVYSFLTETPVDRCSVR